MSRDEEAPLTADPRRAGVPRLAELEDDAVGTEIDIPENAYGAAILSIIRDIPRIAAGSRISLIQGMFSVLLLVANLLLQFSVLFFVNLYVVSPDVESVQRTYAKFRATLFNPEGQLQRDVWEDFDGKDTLCQIAMTNELFFFFLLLLWCLAIAQELRQSEELLRDILSMPRCAHPDQMCQETDRKCRIVALTTVQRALLVLIVCIPKFLISIILLWIGCTWLTATTSFDNLVMNVVALVFVLNVDEMLYEAILPVEHRRQVAEINFFVARVTTKKADYRGFLYSSGMLICTLLFIMFYTKLGQTVLPPSLADVKQVCDAYLSQMEPICKTDWWQGSSSVIKCFPYGTETDS